MEMPPADLPPLERLRRVCYAFRDMAHRNRRLFPMARHCPRLAQAARYFEQPEWDATFALGIEALMAGFTK